METQASHHQAHSFSTMAQYAHLSIPDPEWAEFSTRLPPVKPLTSIQATREEAKVAFRDVINQDPIRVDPYIIKVIETNIPVENGEIRVKAYVPCKKENEAENFPLMVWMYGGGFVLGIIEHDEPLLCNIALNSRITCVCGDYRKAPENPFPAAVDDSCAILKWALNNASELSVDTRKGVIVGGASAGGNIAAVLAHRALKDQQLKDIVTGQLLVIPTVVSPHAHPDKFKSELLSVNNDPDKYVLTKDAIRTVAYLYHGEDNASHPDVSPLLAESFEGLAPAYFQICGLDPYRDEAFLYERLLEEAGVPTKVDVYPGLPHGFHIVFPSLKTAAKQKTDFIEGLDWLLKRKVVGKNSQDQ